MRQIEVELNGLAHMRQRRILNVTDGATDAQIAALAIETMDDEPWDYIAIDDDTVKVTFERQEAMPIYSVEWDPRYTGGEYDKVGDFLDVQPDPGEKVEHAFTRIYGHHHMHIVNYSAKEA